MKTIIVREYLESLKEDRELDALFPILLEVMGYQIISTPKETKGFQQYGKDVIAVGTDEADDLRKRFYFEIKGGEDKNITPTNFNKDDGIRMSIQEAKDRPFSDVSHSEFNHLPVKIVLVHNGIMKESVREAFDGFISREFPGNDPARKKTIGERIGKVFGTKTPTAAFQFERWDIHRLTELFSEKLFNEYLLTDDAAVQHFKKVLLLLNTPGNDQGDFRQLIDHIFLKAGNYAAMGKRQRMLLSETLKLISFIVQSYATEAGNLEPARLCLNYAVIAYWKWLLENDMEKDSEAVRNFKNYLLTYRRFLDEYFARTLPVAKLKKGLWSPSGGRYEQVGYPVRLMAYLGALVNYFDLVRALPKDGDPTPVMQMNDLITVLKTNDAALRPLLDNHSIPLVATLDFMIRENRHADAITLLKNVWVAILMAWRAFERLPDGSNSLKNVMTLMLSQKKSVYYADQTSHLLAILLEYFAVFDLKEDYEKVVGFLKETKIDLAVFVPYDDVKLAGETGLQAKNHEIALFDHMLVREGYQSQVSYLLDYETFKNKAATKNEFSFAYRTVDAGFGFLLNLAHVHFETPFFPDLWRSLIDIKATV